MPIDCKRIEARTNHSNIWHFTRAKIVLQKIGKPMVFSINGPSATRYLYGAIWTLPLQFLEQWSNQHFFFQEHSPCLKEVWVNLFIFIFGRVGSSLMCMGFLYLRRAGATLRCGEWASHCGDLSCCTAQALGVQTSVVVAHSL